MKIQVVRSDGRIETLDLIGRIDAHEAAPNGQGRLTVKNTGMEHFFRAADGAYDGWGMDVSEMPLTLADVTGVVDEIDKGREICEPGQAK